MSTLSSDSLYARPIPPDPEVKRAEALAEWVDDSARGLDEKDLNTLRNLSHTISALGLLSVVAAVVCGFYLLRPGSQVAVVLVFLIASLVAAGGYRSRPSWVRQFGFLHCTLLIFTLSLPAVIGVLGLFALYRAEQLFGDDRFHHDELEEEWKRRRALKK
jgi:hypothetical protein